MSSRIDQPSRFSESTVHQLGFVEAEKDPAIQSLRDQNAGNLNHILDSDHITDQQIEGLIMKAKVADWFKLKPVQKESVRKYLMDNNVLNSTEAENLFFILKSNGSDFTEMHQVQALINMTKVYFVRKQAPVIVVKPLTLDPPLPAIKGPIGSKTCVKPERKKNSILTFEEAKERFSQLENEFGADLDLHRMLLVWLTFYEDTGYAEYYDNNNRDYYDLNVPEISEYFMEALEKGFRSGEYNSLMLDDGRFKDGDTLAIFRPSMTKIKSANYQDELNKSRHLTPSQLRDVYENNGMIPKYIKNLSSPERKVRLVAYQSKADKFYKKRDGHRFSEEISKERNEFETFADAGTYLRIMHFLSDAPAEYKAFTEPTLAQNNPLHRLQVVLNNVGNANFPLLRPMGNGDFSINLFSNIYANPSTSTPLRILASDCF